MLNKIMVIGNVGNDPEMRYTPDGRPVTTFRVATNRRYTTASGDKREDTQWFSVITWRNLAEQVSNYLTKGRLVYVEGRLQTRTWQAQDGTQRFTNEIVADKVLFLSRGPQDGGTPAPETDGVEAAAGADPEDLPF